MMQHVTESDLILYYYDESRGPSRAAIERHLGQCADCHRAYRDLTDVLGVVSHVESPEPPDGYEAELWNRLRPKLASTRRSAWSGIPAPRWVFAGAAAAVVLLAFQPGRQWPAAPVAPAPIRATQTAGVRDRILLVAVGDHLERSELVLVELMNRNPERPLDISAEQASARELVRSNRLYRQSAARSGEIGVESILDELEPILLEIANSPSRLSSYDLQQITQRIDAQGILFKVHVLESRVRARERVTRRDAARLTS